MGQTALLSSDGRRVGDFFALKNPTASVGVEPANLGTRGQHATSRPPKPLFSFVTDITNFKIEMETQHHCRKKFPELAH